MTIVVIKATGWPTQPNEAAGQHPLESLRV
jgi:hypothetical protein